MPETVTENCCALPRRIWAVAGVTTIEDDCGDNWGDDRADDCVAAEFPALTALQPQSEKRAKSSARTFIDGHGVFGILIIIVVLFSHDNFLGIIVDNPSIGRVPGSTAGTKRSYGRGLWAR